MFGGFTPLPNWTPPGRLAPQIVSQASLAGRKVKVACVENRHKAFPTATPAVFHL